ncbi:MAG: 5-(carboxyamino)imidazole ribonucleotide synthase [Azospirillaceae bacterium]|nr:5-(carboxyamino)imidazole ribonucleotide synthase [Azospirillaceae bacterium]
MLGGGQLGRMTAMAAARLGYRTHVFCPEVDSPCAAVAAYHTCADYRDAQALAAFAAAVDVVTLEWENIPVETIGLLSRQVPVHPGAKVLEIAQDRVAEKGFINGQGIATAPFFDAPDAAAAAAALTRLGTSAILKSTRMGYDGKGQVRLDPGCDVAAAWRAMGSDAGIVEGLVDFVAEISVIVARTEAGQMASYPPVENRHQHHILSQTLVPAAITPALAATAVSMAERLAAALQVVGLLAVEMFVTGDGRVLVNELAPRPHNSGHWTIDAAATSQFEQLVRAVCGLPLGSVAVLAPAVMENLIGDQVDQWAAILAEPGARLHLYGKAEARPGRKMGHVTRLLPGAAVPLST